MIAPGRSREFASRLASPVVAVGAYDDLERHPAAVEVFDGFADRAPDRLDFVVGRNDEADELHVVSSGDKRESMSVRAERGGTRYVRPSSDERTNTNFPTRMGAIHLFTWTPSR